MEKKKKEVHDFSSYLIQPSIGQKHTKGKKGRTKPSTKESQFPNHRDLQYTLKGRRGQRAREPNSSTAIKSDQKNDGG